MKKERKHLRHIATPLLGRAQFGTLNTSSEEFSKETVAALEELGSVLRSIQGRMMVEGYVIRDGVVCRATETHENKSK